MEIVRENKRFILTDDELFKAYKEQQHLFDIQNIEENLEEYFPKNMKAGFDKVQNDKELIERAAYKLRKLINKNCSYESALETAIVRTVMESNARIIQVMEDYRKHDIVMSELLRNYSDLTISEKNALLEWSGNLNSFQ